MESPSTQPLREPMQPPPQPSPSPGGLPSVSTPLNLMNKVQKPATYSSPPPVACHPDNNICKLIDYRGAKIAAFMVEGRELICLPQAFELFLKHLVGGLHTVYTKLKRLDITPVVCNVEQVRILRGLGAIQPGVNRCKLISCKEFDILYDDCTNSSARPGRPPKRSPSIHASPETLEKLKKSRLDGTDFPFDPRFYDNRKTLLNGFPHHHYMGPLPFLPLGPPSMMTPPVSLAMASHMALRPDAAAAAAMLKDSRPPVESDLLSPRMRDDRMDGFIKHFGRQSPFDDMVSHARAMEAESDNRPLNLHINGLKEAAARNIVSNVRSDEDDEDDMDDDKYSDNDKDDELEDSLEGGETFHVGDSGEKLGAAPHLHPTPGLLNGESMDFSTIESMLQHIQGLAKIAIETTRQRERQMQFERGEHAKELAKERSRYEQLQKQLNEECKMRVMLQRRLKKERRARRRLQDQGESTGAGSTPSVSRESSVKAGLSPDLSRQHLDEQESEAEKQVVFPEVERKVSEACERPPSHRDLYDSFAVAHSQAGPAPRFPPTWPWFLGRCSSLPTPTYTHSVGTDAQCQRTDTSREQQTD